ncbi:MAG: pitrilysin family protein, partial [Acidobacteriota bacterium]
MAHNRNIPKLPYIKYKLDNGLEVILLEDHRLPLVAVNIWYHVGPVNERPGRTGFAHLFEHMMFEGSKHAGEKAHFRHLEAAGASEINGTTDFDRTNYFETLPSNQLELALWLESDRMGFLLDSLDEEKLENQKDVVRNERRQTTESVPYGIVREEIFHQMFPANHPYHGKIIGSHADIEAAQLDEVRDFFRLYYAPNNASLAIVGDIDPKQTRELVEKYFGPIPAGDPVPAPSAVTPPITSEQRIIVTDQVELPCLYMVWITDKIFTQGDAELDLIAKILGGGKSSRLYKSLVYEKRIAQSVGAHQASLALGSLFYIEGICKPNVKPEELEHAVRQELELFKENGPTPEELESARNTFEAGLVRGLETLGGFGGIADRLNQYNHSLGDPGYLEKDLDRYYAATADSLLRASRSRLNRKAGKVIFGVPGKKVLADIPKMPGPGSSGLIETSSIPNQQWRNTPPPPGPASELTLPTPETFRLENGLTNHMKHFTQKQLDTHIDPHIPTPNAIPIILKHHKTHHL